MCRAGAEKQCPRRRERRRCASVCILCSQVSHATVLTFVDSRFLRGKKFHVEQALEQFKEAHSIREAAGVLELYDNFKVEQFERIRRLV